MANKKVQVSDMVKEAYIEMFEYWCFLYGYVVSHGVKTNPDVRIGDLEGIGDQIFAEREGWA